MRLIRMSGVGTIMGILLTTFVAGGASAQDGSQAFDGLILGSCHFPFDSACDAGVRSVCDGNGQTTFGRAYLHTEHCPQTSGPSSTGGQLELTFDDGSTLDATYAVTCDPVAPEGPGLITCTRYAGEVTHGTGRFEGAMGSIGFEPAYGYFDGVAYPLVAFDWVAIPRGTITITKAAEE